MKSKLRHPSSSSLYRQLYSGGHLSPFHLGVYFVIVLIIVSFIFHSYRQHQEKIALEQAKINLTKNIAKITFPEGLETRRFAELLESNQIISSEVWLDFLRHPEQWPTTWRTKYWFINESIKNTPDGQVYLEGFLFPDTYEFFKSQTPDQVTKVFLDNFIRRSQGLITGNSQVKYDKVILASILEKEVQSAEDMAIVSDLFKRRLNAGMALQSDATLRYILPAKDPTLNFEELKSDSKYNSYKYLGLPPTPIGNPGLKALRAVINPKPNANWFFLTDRNNVVHYGRNYDEHLRNKAKYIN